MKLRKEEDKGFSCYGLEPSVLEDIAGLGFSQPTPVQAECLPHALAGKDVIALAQTGTGKTAVFGLPIVERAAGGKDMVALVLSPTRELAYQITEAIASMGKSSGVRVATLVGGVKKSNDRKTLQRRPHVIVATPGRLLDHIQSRTINLSKIQILTVDEADRMYDMGFIRDIERIIKALPRVRQTLMFSATMPAEVERLVRQHMCDPVRIKVGATAPPAQAEQKLYGVQEAEKMKLLLELLGQSTGRVLVFARTKRKVERLARTVCRSHQAGRLHGDRNQSQRDTAMKRFRDGKDRILIATDIAARGLDVADVEHVINYDFPGSAEDYIHRIGRTARVAASGKATSFVTQNDHACLKQLEKLIAATLPMKGSSHGAPPKPKGRSSGPERPPRRRSGRRPARSRAAR